MSRVKLPFVISLTVGALAYGVLGWTEPISPAGLLAFQVSREQPLRRLALDLRKPKQLIEAKDDRGKECTEFEKSIDFVMVRVSNTLDQPATVFFEGDQGVAGYQVLIQAGKQNLLQVKAGFYRLRAATVDGQSDPGKTGLFCIPALYDPYQKKQPEYELSVSYAQIRR